MLALAQPAEAKIIYTHTHVVIGPYQHYNLDLNGGKVTDFVLENTITGDIPVYALGVGKPGPGDSVVGYRTGGGLNFASALKSGSPIGFSRRFDTFTEEMVFREGFHHLGKWSNVKNRYLGLRFKIRGKIHYGWARLTVRVRSNPTTIITATLTGYAYETVPNKSIIAGKTKGPDAITLEPGSLGALAAGHRGGSH